MALLHVAMVAWVFCSGLAGGPWRRARFEDREGERARVRFFFFLILGLLTLCVLFVALVFCAQWMNCLDCSLEGRGGRQLASQYNLKNAQLSSRIQRREWKKPAQDAEAWLNQHRHQRVTRPRL